MHPKKELSVEFRHELPAAPTRLKQHVQTCAFSTNTQGGWSCRMLQGLNNISRSSCLPRCQSAALDLPCRLPQTLDTLAA